MSKTASSKPSPLLKSRVVNLRDVVEGASANGALAVLFPEEVVVKYFPSPVPMGAYTRIFEVIGITRKDFTEKGAQHYTKLLVEDMLSIREGRKEFQFRYLPTLVVSSQSALYTLFAVGGWVND